MHLKSTSVCLCFFGAVANIDNANVVCNFSSDINVQQFWTRGIKFPAIWNSVQGMFVIGFDSYNVLHAHSSYFD